jgi:hypothetical protein
MKRQLLLLGIILAGAVFMAPAIAMIGLEPVPGDFTINLANIHTAVPVTYSLCASLGLGLLYYLIRG